MWFYALYKKIASNIKRQPLLQDQLNRAIDSDCYSDITRIVPHLHGNLDGRLKISDTKQKVKNERASLAYKLTEEFKKTPATFMSKIETIDFSLFDQQFINDLFKDENVFFIPRILDQILKSMDPAYQRYAALNPSNNSKKVGAFYYLPYQLKARADVVLKARDTASGYNTPHHS